LGQDTLWVSAAPRQLSFAELLRSITQDYGAQGRLPPC